MNPEELQFWKEEFPELDEEDIIAIVEVIDPQPSLADRKQKVIDIEDYTKYW